MATMLTKYPHNYRLTGNWWSPRLEAVSYRHNRYVEFIFNQELEDCMSLCTIDYEQLVSGENLHYNQRYTIVSQDVDNIIASIKKLKLKLLLLGEQI